MRQPIIVFMTFPDEIEIYSRLNLKIVGDICFFFSAANFSLVPKIQKSCRDYFEICSGLFSEIVGRK